MYELPDTPRWAGGRNYDELKLRGDQLVGKAPYAGRLCKLKPSGGKRAEQFLAYLRAGRHRTTGEIWRAAYYISLTKPGHNRVIVITPTNELWTILPEQECAKHERNYFTDHLKGWLPHADANAATAATFAPCTRDIDRAAA